MLATLKIYQTIKTQYNIWQVKQHMKSWSYTTYESLYKIWINTKCETFSGIFHYAIDW
jgi:hypothetical protein